MPTRPTILVFAASNSAKSINRAFANHAAQVLQDELGAPVEIEFLDLNTYEMPIFSPEREADGIPALAHDFRARIASAQGLIIAFAEYNGSYTAAFKNIFDWVSRIEMKIYQDRPMVILATSPGKNGGGNVLKTAVEAAPFFGGDVKGSLSVGPFAEAFDPATGRLTSPQDARALREALVALQAAIPGAV
ncbi:MAG: NAD(P)H-dependent oxidoreductase [Pseudomonadota bacterium]